jgi:hypothetical protein
MKYERDTPRKLSSPPQDGVGHPLYVGITGASFRRVDVRDVTFGEDACRVRRGSAPTRWPVCVMPRSRSCAESEPATLPLPCTISPPSPTRPSVCFAPRRIIERPC